MLSFQKEGYRMRLNWLIERSGVSNNNADGRLKAK